MFSGLPFGKESDFSNLGILIHFYKVFRLLVSLGIYDQNKSITVKVREDKLTVLPQPCRP